MGCCRTFTAELEALVGSTTVPSRSLRGATMESLQNCCEAISVPNWSERGPFKKQKWSRHRATSGHLEIFMEQSQSRQGAAVERPEITVEQQRSLLRFHYGTYQSAYYGAANPLCHAGIVEPSQSLYGAAAKPSLCHRGAAALGIHY